MSKYIKLRDSKGKTATIIMAGDFCPRSATETATVFNVAEITAGVKGVFSDADLRILQWETAITRNDTPILKQGPNLKCDAKWLDFSKSLGFDVHLLANNHTGDFGTDAVMETINVTEAAGIKTVGAGKNKADARKPLFMDIPAGTVAIINFAENEFGIATDDKPGVSPLDPFECIDLIRETAKNADIVIAAMHGGHEFNPVPSPRISKICRAFSDAGADIVFNCHTHCPSSTEVYNSSPIIYSPGNFYFPGSSYINKAVWYFGYLTKFYCDKDGCFAYEIIPYHFLRNSMQLLDEQEEKAFFQYQEQLDRITADKDLQQRLFEAWCCGNAGHVYMELINKTHDDNFPPNWNDPEVISRWIHVKNNFCCESHNDMLRQFSLCIASGKTDIQEKYVSMLNDLCFPDFMESWKKQQAESGLY